MKLRTGFVSNSSSTSFVLMGYEVDEETAERYFTEILKKPPTSGRLCGDVSDAVDEAKDDYITRITGHGIVIGRIIRIPSEGGLGREDLGELNDFVAMISEIGKKLGIGKPRLYTGAYGS